MEGRSVEDGDDEDDCGAGDCNGGAVAATDVPMRIMIYQVYSGRQQSIVRAIINRR